MEEKEFGYRDNASEPIVIKPKPIFGLIIKDRHICDTPKQPNIFALCISNAVKITKQSVWRCATCNKVYMWSVYSSEEWTEVNDLYWTAAGGELDE